MGSRGLLWAAALAVLSLVVAAPAGAAKKGCAPGQVRVLVKGKRSCMRAAALMNSAPAGDLSELLVRATADKSLWRGKTKSATAALGKNAKALFAYDVALIRASRSKGHQLTPREPVTEKRSDDGEETLGLDISKTPIGWVQKQAERIESWKQQASGVQDRQADTKGRLMPPSGKGEYGLEVAEEFVGDPCPQAGGVVTAKATYTVTRTVDGLFSKSVENIATIKVDVKATVGKKGVLLDYTLNANFFMEGGGWSAAAHTNKGAAKPGKILLPSDVASVDLTGSMDADTTAKVAAAMYRAIGRAKEKADLWLKEAQKVWLDKAACKKVTGDTGTLKPGEEREIEVNIKSIRGATTEEEVQLTGRNGLEVVSPKGKVKAKGGKLKVKVKATKRKTDANVPYVLGVEGLSELGRGVGSLEFKGVLSLKFSGLKFRGEVHDIVYGTSYSEYEVVEAHFCGVDPYKDPWYVIVHEVSNWPLFGGHTFDGNVPQAWFDGGAFFGQSIIGAQGKGHLVQAADGVPTGINLEVGYVPGYEPQGSAWDVQLIPQVTQAPVVEDPVCTGLPQP